MNKNNRLKNKSVFHKIIDITDNQGETQLNSPQLNNLSTVIVDKFVRLEGIKDFAITKPYLNSKYIEYYKYWLNSGFNSSMQWMEKNADERGNLQIRFPWARSVIVFADNYYVDKSRNENTLKISRYAWGDDYHKVLLKKIKRILENLKQYDKTIEGKAYVDTGPILEKCFAIESGLGWMGKNSQIIIPNVGSYVFLGVLILNKEFEEYGNPIESRCGDCTKCVDNCPTGAIVENYTIDCNKCISYFSIEKKDDFTPQEEKWLRDWLYGCDMCLESCPWNKKWAKTSGEISYFNRIEMLERSVNEWKDLTEEEFGKLFQKNVFKRLKYQRFRRNLLANIKNIENK